MNRGGDPGHRVPHAGRSEGGDSVSTDPGREAVILQGIEKLQGWPQGRVGLDQNNVGHNESRGTITPLGLYQQKDGSIVQTVEGDTSFGRETFMIISLEKAKEMMNELQYESLVSNLRKQAPPEKLPTREMPDWMKKQKAAR